MTARLGNTFSLSGTQSDGEALQLFGDQLVDGSQKHGNPYSEYEGKSCR